MRGDLCYPAFYFKAEGLMYGLFSDIVEFSLFSYYIA